MTSDTIRQKYIYNTPYDDNEFPLVLEDSFDIEKDKYTSINASYLYCLEEQDFKRVVQNIKTSNIDKVIIRNDYCAAICRQTAPSEAQLLLRSLLS